MSKYKVNLRQGYPYEVRRIAGLVIDANGFEGELTAAQLKELRADSAYVTVSAVTAPRRTAAAKPAKAKKASTQPKAGILGKLAKRKK